MQLGGMRKSLMRRLAVTLLQKMVPAEKVVVRPAGKHSNSYASGVRSNLPRTTSIPFSSKTPTHYRVQVRTASNHLMGFQLRRKFAALHLKLTYCMVRVIVGQEIVCAGFRLKSEAVHDKTGIRHPLYVLHLGCHS